LKTIPLFILLFPNVLIAQIIFSEVLYNEPGSRINLEWVEVYNSGHASVDLGGMELICGTDTSACNSGSVVGPSQYAVLARQLTSQNGGDSFEGHWGDSSGFWGDYVSEEYPAFKVSMSLPNESGSIKLIDTFYNPIDSVSWEQPTADGFSWERDDINAPRSEWHQCTDQSGSTPGKVNSRRPLNNQGGLDIEVEPRILSYKSNIQTFVRIKTAIPKECQLTVEIFDDGGKRRKMLIDNSGIAAASFTWCGIDENGQRLTPGIYIILFTLTGAVSENKSIPIVIAP
jgi:hypothetical protein